MKREIVIQEAVETNVDTRKMTSSNHITVTEQGAGGGGGGCWGVKGTAGWGVCGLELKRRQTFWSGLLHVQLNMIVFKVIMSGLRFAFVKLSGLKFAFLQSVSNILLQGTVASSTSRLPAPPCIFRLPPPPPLFNLRQKKKRGSSRQWSPSQTHQHPERHQVACDASGSFC